MCAHHVNCEAIFMSGWAQSGQNRKSFCNRAHLVQYKCLVIRWASERHFSVRAHFPPYKFRVILWASERDGHKRERHSGARAHFCQSFVLEKGKKRKENLKRIILYLLYLYFCLNVLNALEKQLRNSFQLCLFFFILPERNRLDSFRNRARCRIGRWKRRPKSRAGQSVEACPFQWSRRGRSIRPCWDRRSCFIQKPPFNTTIEFN